MTGAGHCDSVSADCPFTLFDGGNGRSSALIQALKEAMPLRVDGAVAGGNRLARVSQPRRQVRHLSEAIIASLDCWA